MKSYIELSMQKFKQQKEKLVSLLRAEVNYQVSSRVSLAIEKMNTLREHIVLDMKKWSNQRSDMQLEIGRMLEVIYHICD